MINVGKYDKLRVLRKSDLGYMLGDGTEEVLMHFKQATEELEIGAELVVFVYSDKEKRPCATMNTVNATIDNPGFVKVIEVLPSIGLFVDNNTTKDVLVSKDYLPYQTEAWPQVGDTLFIKLKQKNNVLTGKPLNRFDIIELHSPLKFEEFDTLDGYVCRVTEKGIGIVTTNMVYVFVPTTQMRGTHRMGEAVSVVITKKVNGECYGTLNTRKEDMIDGDREIILKYLEDHHGVIKYTSKSPAEVIEKVFKMSRKAFKRAYGSLYKERLIEFDEEKTYLVKYMRKD